MMEDLLEHWLNQLPQLAKEHESQLMGFNALFSVETRQGRHRLIRLQEGRVELPEASAEAPTCSLTADEADLLAMLEGRLNPAKALMMGKVKIKGNVKPLMALLKLLK